MDETTEAVTERKTFTYKHSPAHGRDDRWICHDPDRHAAGEFRTEEEARAAVERWNTRDGHLVTITWTRGDTDASWDRGTYKIALDGSRWRKVTAGTFGMEESKRIVMKVRDLVAEHGIEAVRKFAEALG
jgi:hypothetical protein